MKQEKQSTVFWAIDVLQPNRALKNRMVGELRRIQAAYDAAIVPVHVLSPSVPFAGTALHGHDPEETKAAASYRMRDYLRGVKLPRLAEPVVVDAVNGSLRGRASALLEAARQRGARLIVLSTYSRTGVARFLMGSFTETLMTFSDVPLLVVNPTASPTKGPILFASDLQGSDAALPEALFVAKRTRAPVVLFHHVAPSVQYWVEPLTNTTLYRAKRKGDVSLLKEIIQRHSDRIAAAGVKSSPLLSEKGGSPAESILLAAKAKKARLVVVTTTKSPLEANVLGSTARQVVRHSKCPVWVIHA